ncbi:hypothetical protein [Microbacterium aquilitoris]|uniref:hypothetical protein n=1 Tax=Microbacterium aquilitoris TaxID=3067307 RepID=UPI00288F8B21|nr:hypothetical protein [Microbacterium sp. KSW2-22]MDT3343768.1 hypothetical protein [Microbacterium sp. KSW2-22]
MTHTAIATEVTLWLVDETPARMCYAGQRWTVTDTPTRLRRSVWSVDPDDVGGRRGLFGWRFQATNEACESIVFDIYGGPGEWHVHRRWS